MIRKEFCVYMPQDLREMIGRTAEMADRSISNEIIYRLRLSLAADKAAQRRSRKEQP